MGGNCNSEVHNAGSGIANDRSDSAGTLPDKSAQNRAGRSTRKTRRLNKRELDKLKASNKRGEKFYDSVLSGFGVSVFPSGTKSFFIDYGPRQSRRRYHFGKYGIITVEQARSQARELIGRVQAGIDPNDERDIERQAETFKEWTIVYVESLEGRKKKTSIKADELYLGRAIKLFGRKKLNSLTVSDVERFFESQKEKGTVTANRALASLRTCLQSAWRRNLIPDNIAMKIKPLTENPPRARVLSDEEMRRFVIALESIESPHVRAAFKILIATGARKSEVLGMKYQDIDVADPDSATWRLERPKSGRPETKPLTADIVKIINSLPKKSAYVIAGRNPFKPRADLKKPWDFIREEASIQGVTIHDVRRTFGLEVAKTAGVHVASKLLGHSTIRVTEQVYAPLGIDDLRMAAESVGKKRKEKVSKL